MKKALALIQKVQIAVAACFLLIFLVTIAFQMFSRFAGIAAVSPSVWFPGFAEYTVSHFPKAEYIYLSLGEKEEKVRNPVLAAVGGRIRELHGLLQARGISCCLEWNEGNHFRDADLRTAKAFAWVMRQESL